MNLTIVRITARGLLGRRRFLLLIPLPVLLVGLAELAHTISPEHVRDWGTAIVGGLGFGVLLPVVALIVASSVLGAEIDDGTIVHILAKPVPRRDIVLAKLAVAVGVTTVVSAVPMFLAGLIAVSTRYGLGLALSCLVGSLAYCALFLLLSLLSRRPVLVGLLYILLWEDTLSSLLSGTRVLSVTQYAISVAVHAGGTADLIHTRLSLPVAVVMSAVFLVAGTVLAIDRLRSFTLTGETS